jgi:hypothetical protein
LQALPICRTDEFGFLRGEPGSSSAIIRSMSIAKLTKAEFDHALHELYADPATQPIIFDLRNRELNATLNRDREQRERLLDEMVALMLGHGHLPTA